MANEPNGTELDETSRDWPAETAETIVKVVDDIRAKTTGNVQKLVKFVVYGLLALFLGLLLLLLLLVGFFRFVDAYLPPSDSSWSAWLLLGVLFTALGSFLWFKRGRLLAPRS